MKTAILVQNVRDQREFVNIFIGSLLHVQSEVFTED